jgi:hypothetical protein
VESEVLNPRSTLEGTHDAPAVPEAFEFVREKAGIRE